MINYTDFFIAIYSHECKSYCDEQFFKNLLQSDIGDASIHVVDNTIHASYAERIKDIIKSINVHRNIHVSHIFVDRDDPTTQFQRNVAESLSFLRNIFLETKCKYFIIVESDVIPPADWLHYFMEVIDKADIIGGIYYHGFHDIKLFEDPTIFQETHHVLSGCSLYKREVIEKIPFRWSTENLGAFPDAWMSYDAHRNGNNFRLANYSKIQCQHVDKPGSMTRGQETMR
jgi:hypothetical protein